MPASDLFKSREAFEPVGADRGAGSHIVLDKRIESDALEVWDDSHPYTTWSSSPLLHCDDDESSFSAFQLTASPQTGLSPTNPGIVHLHFAAQLLAFLVNHRSAKLVQHHPRRLVTSQTELTL